MGRLLAFPQRVETPLSTNELSELATAFVAGASGAASPVEVVSNPDLLNAVIAQLREDANRNPKSIAACAAALHATISDSRNPVGLFDEHDFFSGELALIVGGTSRYLGEFSDANRWLDLAEGSFRHTVNPAPLLARVAYARLTICFDLREHDRVLEMVPALVRSFERLGMRQELQKTRFVEAMSLKEAGRFSSAFDAFRALRDDLSAEAPSLLSRVLIELGAEYARTQQFPLAASTYEEAMKFVAAAGEPMSLAHLRATIGETYRDMGNHRLALECFRSAVSIYAEIGMKARVAYLRVVAAETLLLADRQREAEWEICAALPIIEEEKLVAEGVAAMALLRESIRRRKLDPDAIRDLKKQLSIVA